MAETEAGLAKGRTRRDGAGNRMRALLDGEFRAEEGFEETEHDHEFRFKGDVEGDEYESDFESTGDEAEEVDAGEKVLEAEARQARKEVARRLNSRAPVPLPKPNHPSLNASRDDHPPLAKKRRFQKPASLDSETGEVLDNATRKSSRSSTVTSKQQLHTRLKDEHERRVTVPRREKREQRALSQADRMVEALATETINTASLNTFLTEEEEERAAHNAHLKWTPIVEAPLLRWISRAEQVRVPMIVEVEIPGLVHRKPQVSSPLVRANSNLPGSATSPVATYAPYGAYNASSSGANAVTGAVGSSPAPARFISSPYYHAPLAASGKASGAKIPQSSLNLPRASYVTQTKNYVTLDTPDATPEEDFGYLFGKHVDWGTLKVLPKNHPPTRRVTACPLTGLAARYIHPTTQIPFANVRAYDTIESLLKHRYVWSDGMGAYVGDEERKEGATGVPAGWENAVIGE